MKIRHSDHRDKIELQMTPMIDIVFQLLIFFIMTFKIVLPEGDFNVRMPLAASESPAPPSETPTLRLEMTADGEGKLVELRLGDLVFTGEDRFAKLHAHVRSLVGDAGGPGVATDQEVDIDADYGLRYDYVMRAITALTGYIENGQRHQLIERVRLTPPDEA
ncbi:Biopolymer transport protein ExbD/TolR [Pseudobythopirellula maris]|uniref:Biopolymer transport protein ExbD/TolR n=1 Tax=Pseudobythopirellula maris TaxID=2527991 RepID=A0A5C5ZHK1_9BACT|nr:biopolymer transporter ExbD [Pseudobythopirellula maris]TWT86824.1 Biopolymer transport protein ExbD/TolR [Pseudobythopirellula maris]